MSEQSVSYEGADQRALQFILKDMRPRTMVRLSGPARVQRADERRGQILRAALDVFGRRGFHGATIKEIAATAGLAEGTIYLYFTSKQEVLKGVFTLIAEEVAASPLPEEPREGDDTALLTSLVRARVRTLVRHASFLRLVVHEADLQEDLRREFFARLHEPFVEAFDRYLERRISQGVFRPVNTALTSSTFFRMIMSYVMVQHVLALNPGLMRYGTEDHIDAMVGLALYGLLSRPASAV